MTGSPTILLVEDEQQQRDSLSMLFETQGYGAVSVESAERALEHLAKNRVDMIITDVKLPDMDGFTFFDRVRALPAVRTVPFIFITGYNDPRAIAQVKALGAAGYITKPYDLEDLLSLVKTSFRNTTS